MTATTRRSLVSDEDQGVTFVELFFDLVFVFAVTEVTHYLATHLHWTGVGRSVLIFWLVWWAWTQFTWALNPADTTLPIVRSVTLIAVAVALIMALGAERAFTAAEAWWFAIPYVAVRLIGLGLYLRVAWDDAGFRRSVSVFGSLSLLGMAAVLVGAAVDPGVRGWAWLAAIALDLLAANVGGRRDNWNIRPGHFTERHGLFVIIALGESVIVVGATAADLPFTRDLMLVVIGCVVVTGLLWWTYFGWIADEIEHHVREAPAASLGPLVRDAFSVLHFPLIGGIIGVAVGFEAMVAHPADPLPKAAALAVGVGVALFTVGAGLSQWRAHGRPLPPRLVLGVATGVLIAAVPGPSPLLGLMLMAVGLVAVIVTERPAHRLHGPT